MKAARYYGKHDLRVEDAAEPPQPGHGEVVVAPTFCGICGTDLHEFESGPIFTPKTPNAYSGALLPQILGHEFAGRVVAVGPGVRRFGPATGSRSSRRSARARTTMDSATSAFSVQRRRSSG